MRYEKSCGFVAYTEENGLRLYCIIRAHNGEYGFPKGHMEDGETEPETATRELKEETGLTVEQIPGFRCQIQYPFPSKPEVMKQAIYFLGKCTGNTIRCQATEVAEGLFLPLEEALGLLSFESTRQILRQAEEFLSKRH